MRFWIFFLTVIALFNGPLWAQGAYAQSLLDDNQSTQSSTGGSVTFGGEEKTFINQYSKKYKKVTEEDINNINSGNLLQADNYTVQLVRHPDDSYGTVNLRIQSPMNIQGCGSASFPWVNVERKGKTINISMGAPQLIPGADMRYPHYECKISGATPSIDIPLSRNEMIAYGVKRIKIDAGTLFDQFNVEFGKNNMSLIPVSQNAFRAASRSNALTHVFYPVNMVILRVPNGLKDKKLAQKMDDLARKHKLTPIEKPIPNAKPYQFYALDKEYNVMMPLQKRGITKLDTIKIDDILYGQQGAYTVQRDADVFVTLPGEFD